MTVTNLDFAARYRERCERVRALKVQRARLLKTLDEETARRQANFRKAASLQSENAKLRKELTALHQTVDALQLRNAALAVEVDDARREIEALGGPVVERDDDYETDCRQRVADMRRGQ